jgi:hypothetical protein
MEQRDLQEYRRIDEGMAWQFQMTSCGDSIVAVDEHVDSPKTHRHGPITREHVALAVENALLILASLH